MQGLSEYQGQLIFVLEPGEKVSSDEENEKLYIRPNFSFDPKNDTLLPCHEAGLGFHPGCILEVIQRKEEWWWQARMITNQFRNTDQIRNNKSAGLIPSSALGLFWLIGWHVNESYYMIFLSCPQRKDAVRKNGENETKTKKEN